MKGTGHPTSHAYGSGQASSLTGTPLRTKVHWTAFTFIRYWARFLIKICVQKCSLQEPPLKEILGTVFIKLFIRTSKFEAQAGCY